MMRGRSSVLALINRRRLFCAESMRWPITSLRLHFSGRGFAENSASGIARMAGSIFAITAFSSSTVDFITIPRWDRSEILHPFHPAKAEGTHCVHPCVLLRRLQRFQAGGGSNALLKEQS